MIAIIQGGCFGDNVNSTLMLRPLKEKYPNKEIHIYTSSKYASPFYNNPFIDRIFETETTGKNESLNLAHSIKPVGYDIVINSHPLINKNWASSIYPELGENLILAWVNTLESLGVEYNFPIETGLYLTDEEVKESDEFVESIKNDNDKVLIECGGESGQSFWNDEWTKQISEYLIKSDKTVIISCLKDPKIKKPNVHWVGKMSIRVVSGIFDHCYAFISTSSGLSNACNVVQRSENVKWFEVVNSLSCSSNVVGSRSKIFWHKNDIKSFIEMLEEQL